MRLTTPIPLPLFDDAAHRGYPYTGYEFDGQRCQDVTYLGEFENGKMPANDYVCQQPGK